ncbi:hypothetical protein ACHAPP_008860 [Verticillium nonalfalfae]
MASRVPATWDDYERGASPRSVSIDSNAVAEDQSLLDDGDQDYQNDEHRDSETGGLRRRRRRSSVTRHLAAVADLGGVNSIRSFTRSWARAAGFAEVIPQRPSFIFAPDQAPLAPSTDGLDYGRSHVDASSSHPRTSLLRQHLEAQSPGGGGGGGEGAAPFDAALPGEGAPLLAAGGSHRSASRDPERKHAADHADLHHRASFSSSTRRASIFAVPPHLATPPLVGSYSSYRTYGTLPDVDAPSMAEAGDLWRQQQADAADLPAGEHLPILVKEVEQDGKIVLAVEGQSTLPQTIFNSINVLIGVGLLSLPLGIKYAGWVCGMTILLLSAAVTSYTAKLLAKCMDLDASLITFSDLAYISYGRNARIATSILFTMELLAACVALFVLFADTLVLLFPGVLTLTMWKFVCALLLIPLNFLPLRLLSFTSVIGIMCCFSIVSIVVIDGLIKQDTPGSLIEPARTYLFPANWLTLPLSFGLLMSPWGGHSVFPNIYRDMRHPQKFGKAIKVTFSFSYALDAVTAVVGLLMFGDGVLDEITANILKTSGYPRALTILLCVFIAIIPLTKIPLNGRPIIATVEVLAGLHHHAMADSDGLVGRSATFRGFMRIFIRVATILLFLVSPQLLCYVIMAVSTTLSFIGTVWAFLPKDLIGAA